MKVVDLSIIILNYNTRELLRNCLDAVQSSKLGPFTLEVIVVDNGSTDASWEMLKKDFPKIHLIRLGQNVGFAAGNNLGLKKAKGRYLLLLNSDTEVSHEALRKMLVFMEDHPEAAAATARLRLPNGELDPASHRGFPTPWASLTYFLGLENLFSKSRLFGQYHQGYKNLNKPHEIDSPSGAFFLVRHETVTKVGLLDEDFFMYGEDLDWAYRMRQTGLKILFNPEVSVLHRKRQSGRESQDRELRRQTQDYFYDSMRLFYQKHYAQRYGWLVTQLVLLGIKFRSFI